MQMVAWLLAIVAVEPRTASNKLKRTSRAARERSARSVGWAAARCTADPPAFGSSSRPIDIVSYSSHLIHA